MAYVVPAGDAQPLVARDLAVPRGALAHLALARERLRRPARAGRRAGRAAARSERSSSSSCLSTVPKSTRAASSNDERRSRRPSGTSTSSRLRDLDQPPERLERAFGVLGVGRLLVVVLERLDLGGPERAALGQLDDPEALAALDEDVHPAVVERVHELDHAGARPDLPQPVGVLEDQAELGPVGEALADQLACTRSSKMWSGTRSLGSSTSSSGKRPISGTQRSLSAATVLAWPRPSPRSPTASSGLPSQGLVPYEPGKPVEEVQRELGLDRVRQAGVERRAVRAVPGSA